MRRLGLVTIAKDSLDGSAETEAVTILEGISYRLGRVLAFEMNADVQIGAM
jgi:hypothetical protein